MESTSDKTRIGSRWVFLYEAIIYAVGLVLSTGLISSLGYWYSRSYHFRAQVNAFIHGSLSLSRSPSSLEHDLVWSNGGVHQVWGLGIPAWRLPFEFIARQLGLSGFPDMLAFMAAAALTAWALLLSIWKISTVQHTLPGTAVLEERRVRSYSLLLFISSVSILLLFPPFINLLQSSPFQVYEEVVAYEYLYGIFLIAQLVELTQRPAKVRYWCLCAFAGFGGLLRPTLVLHGAAALLSGSLMIWLTARLYLTSGAPALSTLCQTPDLRTAGSTASRPAGSATSHLENFRTVARYDSVTWKGFLIGFTVWLLGLTVLYGTNWLRFGNGWEFGHRLNVQQGNYGAMYSTRFDYPYKAEPVISASRELFGLMFLTQLPEASVSFYASGMFPGQSDTVRWRHMYLTTYSPIYVLGLAAGALATLIALCRLKRGARGRLSNDPAAGPGLLAVLAVGLYGWTSGTLLFAFYLRREVMASRYLLDFMPSFASLMLSGWLAWAFFWARRRRGGWILSISTLVIGTWIGWELFRTNHAEGAPRMLNWDQVQKLAKPRSRWTNPPVSGVYGSAAAPLATAIPFNGSGWDQASGRVMPCITLFVNDPVLLEIDVAAQGGTKTAPDPAHFRAKIGIEELKRDAVIPTRTGFLIRFRGPSQLRYQSGLQPAFIATVPNTRLGDESTEWRMLSVRWRPEEGHSRASNAMKP